MPGELGLLGPSTLAQLGELARALGVPGDPSPGHAHAAHTQVFRQLGLRLTGARARGSERGRERLVDEDRGDAGDPQARTPDRELELPAPKHQRAILQQRDLDDRDLGVELMDVILPDHAQASLRLPPTSSWLVGIVTNQRASSSRFSLPGTSTIQRLPPSSDGPEPSLGS